MYIRESPVCLKTKKGLFLPIAFLRQIYLHKHFSVSQTEVQNTSKYKNF